ncbi:hypothetical protein ACFFRR_006038 [Megaselia abdita]
MKVLFLTVFAVFCASKASARQPLRELLPPITFCLFKSDGNYPNMRDDECRTFIRCNDRLPLLLPCILPNFRYNEKTKTCTWRAKCVRDSGTTTVPVTVEPETDEPTEEPVTDEPTEDPVTDEPVTDEPTEEPATDEPTEEPVTDEPTEEPVTDDPTEEPVTDEPTEEPVTDEPTEEPVTDVPVKCSPNGHEWLPHPTDCIKFFRCVNGVAHEFSCPSGTLYDESIQNCNHANLVRCDKQ